jgi:uncharacterized membrane protein YphA (DoxX/SURF4 family)
MTGYAQYKKVPAAKLSVIVSGLMILVGGLYIAFGVYADLGALLIALFLLTSSIHDARILEGNRCNSKAK